MFLRQPLFKILKGRWSMSSGSAPRKEAVSSLPAGRARTWIRKTS